MLLTYLFKHYLEEADFLKAAGLSAEELAERLRARSFPAASYRIESETRAESYLGPQAERGAYRFHLKGHLDWLAALRRLELDSEARARSYFEQAYGTARWHFFSGPLGRDMLELVPGLAAPFDAAKAEETWREFLAGVYGLCTRDGQPGSIFLKQAGVLFIERLTAAAEPAELSAAQRAVLARAVALLDGVLSDFAPQEVARSSRQRCILDVTARYLRPAAA